jgi:hypothetical protein
MSNIVAMAGGVYDGLALRDDDSVVSWGYPSSYGTLPAGLSNVVAIDTFGSHSIALQSNGEVRAWGPNSFGETNVPTNLTGVLKIDAGAFHCLALSVPPPGPRLQIVPSGSSVMISWPASASNFVLQSSSALASEAGWTNVLEPHQIIGAQATISQPISERQRFFRLSRR